jgi:uncharacterized protein (DUF362 family)
MAKSHVVIRSTTTRSVERAVEEVMQQCGWESAVPPGAHVVLKPNLCTPSPEILEMANVSDVVLSAVCAVLATRTHDVTICESDGVRYTAEEAFEMSRTYAVAKRFGFQAKSLSRDTLVETDHPHLRGWPLPKLLLDCDCFITLAKIKTHATTAYTGALKNQWGCVPQHNRLILHKHLHTLIGDVNRILKPRLGLTDGLVGMEGRGPINGRPVRLGVIAGSTDLVALDAACMRFVGLDPATAEHLVHAAQIGLGKMGVDEVTVDADCAVPKPFLPAEQDWPIKAMNLITKSEFLTRHLLLNDSIFFPARWVANFARRAKARIAGAGGQDHRTSADRERTNKETA